MNWFKHGRSNALWLRDAPSRAAIAAKGSISGTLGRSRATTERVGDYSTFAWVAAGLMHGARHAFEPDHMAAVSTLVSTRRSPSQGFRFAGAWGLGHACTLLVLSGTLACFGWSLPPRIATALELLVAMTLVAVGLRSLLLSRRMAAAGSEVAHVHGALRHQHASAFAHVHVGTQTFATLPFVVGLVHGLAGSGTLAVVLSVSMPNRAYALVYVALYGLGAAVAMASVGAVVLKPLGRFLTSQRARCALVGVSGALSVAVGLIWGVFAAFT
jgi:hypothetical protein